MSSSITWAFPTSENGINGTVNIDDIIVLQWIDDIDYPHWPILYCEDGDPPLVNTTATTSPFAFLFTTKVTTGNTTSCHFDFRNSSSAWLGALSSGFTYNGSLPAESKTWSLSVDNSGDTSSTVSANAGVDIQTSTSSSATSTGTGTTSSATASAETSSAKASLSTGADAGIGVGVGVGAILLALGSFLYWRRRRSTAVDKTSKDYTPVNEDAHEMDGVGQERKELATTEKPQELEPHRHPGELEALERTMEPVELP